MSWRSGGDRLRVSFEESRSDICAFLGSSPPDGNALFGSVLGKASSEERERRQRNDVSVLAGQGREGAAFAQAQGGLCARSPCQAQVGGWPTHVPCTGAGWKEQPLLHLSSHRSLGLGCPPSRAIMSLLTLQGPVQNATSFRKPTLKPPAC